MAWDRMFGVLGGMGPLASAEFAKTIYERCLSGDREQASPKVLVYSNPAIPDRTETLLSGNPEPLLAALTDALQRLLRLDVDPVVVCCVTTHHLIPRLPPELRERLICLVSESLRALVADGRTHLVLCSNATRRLEVFESHPLWPEAAALARFPSEEDQQRVHGLIYRIKLNGDLAAVARDLRALKAQYGVHGLLAGCTEFHLLSKRFAKGEDGPEPVPFIDALEIIARRLGNGHAHG